MVLNNSLAAFRPPAAHQQDLAVLAQTHFQNDLTSDDRDVLVSAAATLQRYAAVGSLVGIGVGCLLAYRVRALRRNWFVEFQTRMVGRDRPRRLVFESGKDVEIPDVAAHVAAPSAVGDIAAYTLLGMGGLFLGGETGLLTGSAVARRRVLGDEARVGRVREAYRRFRIDVLRKEAEELEKGAAGGKGTGEGAQEEEVIW